MWAGNPLVALLPPRPYLRRRHNLIYIGIPNINLRRSADPLMFIMGIFIPVMPPPHCCEFCLRTNANWHSLRIAQHSNDSNYFVLARSHFRISSQANTNVLKCSKHSYWPCESKPIRIASYCITERRINSCQFLLVRISSLYIRIYSLYRGMPLQKSSILLGMLLLWVRCYF